MKYRYRFYKHYFRHTFLRGMRCRLFLCNYMMFIILKMLIFLYQLLILWTQLVKSLHFEKKAECFKKEKKKKNVPKNYKHLRVLSKQQNQKKKTDKNNIWEETPFPVAVCLFYYFIMNFYKEISYEVLRCELF